MTSASSPQLEPLPDWYAVLQVAPDASPEVIHNAYRALVKQYHPDKFHGRADQPHQRMAQINQAYTTLSDETRRARYDRERKRHAEAVAAAKPTPIQRLGQLFGKVPWWGWLIVWGLIFPRILRVLMISTTGQIILGIATIFVFWRLMPKRPVE